MKISGQWLRDYVNYDITAEELAKRLTLVGIEISSITPLSVNLSGVVVGQVLTKGKHPQADRLSVCEVDVGGEVVTIICGAPNVDAGQKVPVALVGSILPGGLKIEARKIRGVMSQGMICSEKELGISEEAAGIMILEENAPIGKPLVDVLPLGDIILDAELTPNRPDCLSMMGIAREVAIITGKPLHRPSSQLPEASGDVTHTVSVKLHDPQGCPRYTARIIQGVKVGPSPVWLSRRLLAAGIRSINNVVDVTNVVMMELGQPLHAFDYDLLRGGQIQVRRSREGERFVTLDGQEHTLNGEVLLICDGDKPLALAGIMGGLESEVGPETKNILLESAYFEPTVIRRGSKAMSISTESSQRFERGVDPNGVVEASNRATQLILRLAGGKPVGGIIDQYPATIDPLRIKLRVRRVNQILGTRLKADQIRRYLESLGMEVSGDDHMEVWVPTFRPDITREIDIIEEVARLYGYDRIEASVRAGGEIKVSYHHEDQALQRIRATLCGLGMQEVITNSLTDPQLLKDLGYSEQARAILNPLSEDLSVLRPILVPGLIQVLRHNLRRAIKDVRIFEVGKVFRTPQNGATTDERWSLCGLLAGKRWPSAWDQQEGLVDFYDLKGLLESVLQKLSIDKFRFLPYDEGGFYHAGYAATLMIGENYCGHVGQVGPKVLSDCDLNTDVFVFELDITPLIEAISGERRYVELPKFPSADRDLAIVVSEEVSAGEVEGIIRQAGGQLIANIRLFDVYRGKQIASGKKSLAYALRYQSPNKTLTDEEVEIIQQDILTALKERLGAQLRTS